MAFRFGAAILCALAMLIAFVRATPTLSLPFNSQVPKVARADQAYLFEFSSSTFAPEATNFTYSLAGQPAWLLIDSATRTLSGTPGAGDIGADTFLLTAADSTGAAHMQCTIVVSSELAPKLQGDVSKEVAATANLSSTDPALVTILPSSSFQFEFQPHSLIDTVQRKLYYYSTLSDHTPLPSWLGFNADTLTFSGTAPDLSAFPHSWDVDLIASDVEGFAGASTSFLITIGEQQLVFVPSEQSLNISAGMHVNSPVLRHQIYRNGTSVAPASLKSASVSTLPPWLEFDSSTLGIQGTVPLSNASDQSIEVTVADHFGNTAKATINLMSGTPSLFAETIETLAAYPGQAFTYQIPPTIFKSEQDLDLKISLPAMATWLQFDVDARELKGTVPTQIGPTSIKATLTAQASSMSLTEIQVFTIDVKPTAIITLSSSTLLASWASPTTSSTGNSLAPILPAEISQHASLSGGVIATIVLSLILAALLAALLILYCRKWRCEGYERNRQTPDRNSISRSVPQPEGSAIVVTTDLHTDVEKAYSQDSPLHREPEPAPQIGLDLPSQSNRKSRWIKRFSHMSQVSSLGDGEDATGSDSNISERGQNSVVIHTPPHDGFSLPPEMVRVSIPSHFSPTRRVLKRLRERHEPSVSQASVGMGVKPGDETVLPRQSSKSSKGYGRGGNSFGISAGMSRSSQASISTRGTSVLSARPSEFPRPPSRSTFTLSRSIPSLSVTDAVNLNMIRLVPQSDGLTIDEGSLADKRRSYIRNRVNSSFVSPLFSHGLRAPCSKRETTSRSGTTSSMTNGRRPRRGNSKLTAYSESSSLEQQYAFRESRRRSSRSHSARVRSVLAPSFPRAITESSMDADDEDGESDYCTTESSISETDLAAESALPQHQREWMLPGEALSTPPPVSPTSRQPSDSRQLPSDYVGPRQHWKDRMEQRSSSPLAATIAFPVSDRGPWRLARGHKTGAKSCPSEPTSLVSIDSLSQTESEGPQLVHTSSKRSVSVEEVKRLGSLRAKMGTHTDHTRAGSEMWVDADSDQVVGTGLIPTPLSLGSGKTDTQRSNMSGPAFL